MSLLKKKMALLAVKTEPAVFLNASFVLSNFITNQRRLSCNNDGGLEHEIFGSLSFVANNYVPNADMTAGRGDAFEVMLTNDGGATNPTSGPSLATWHAMTVDRLWEWTTAGPTGTFTVQIREIANTGNNDSAAVSFL